MSHQTDTLPSQEDFYERCIHTAEPPPDEPECSICRDEWNQSQRVISILLCKHIFHEICVCEWLEDKRTCPLCRQELYQETSTPSEEVFANDDATELYQEPPERPWEIRAVEYAIGLYNTEVSDEIESYLNDSTAGNRFIIAADMIQDFVSNLDRRWHDEDDEFNFSEETLIYVLQQLFRLEFEDEMEADQQTNLSTHVRTNLDHWVYEGLIDEVNFPLIDAFWESQYPIEVNI